MIAAFKLLIVGSTTVAPLANFHPARVVRAGALEDVTVVEVFASLLSQMFVRAFAGAVFLGRGRGRGRGCRWLRRLVVTARFSGVVALVTLCKIATVQNAPAPTLPHGDVDFVSSEALARAGRRRRLVNRLVNRPVTRLGTRPVRRPVTRLVNRLPRGRVVFPFVTTAATLHQSRIVVDLSGKAYGRQSQKGEKCSSVHGVR